MVVFHVIFKKENIHIITRFECMVNELERILNEDCGIFRSYFETNPKPTYFFDDKGV